MTKPNSQRIRRTVELGPDVERMLVELHHCGKIRDYFGYYGTMNEAFIIRLALRQLYQALLPEGKYGSVDVYAIAGNNASGRTRRQRAGGRVTRVQAPPQ